MAATGSRIQRLLDRQGEALARLTDQQARDLLRTYEDARRELRERLEAMGFTGRDQATPFTAQHLRVTLAQVEASIRDMEARLNASIDASLRTQRERALQDLLRVIAAAEPNMKAAGSQIEVAAVQRLSAQHGLLLHQHSVHRYGSQVVEAIQRELVIGTTSSQSWRQLTERIVGRENSVFAGMRHRAELIVRMESSRVYNEGHQAGLEEAAAVLDEPGRADPLQKRADEYADRRNHPLSRALHGRLAPIAGEWQVPVSEVTAWGRVLGKSTGGIVWREEAGFYVGASYPAHYNDRGRMTPWRSSWGEPGQEPRPDTV